jgi:hypothetical protein
MFLYHLPKMWQRTIQQTHNPLEQAVFIREAIKRILAAFVNGLAWGSL